MPLKNLRPIVLIKLLSGKSTNFSLFKFKITRFCDHLKTMSLQDEPCFFANV